MIATSNYLNLSRLFVIALSACFLSLSPTKASPNAHGPGLVLGHEISFKPGDPQLSRKQAEDLELFLREALEQGRITNIQIIAWIEDDASLQDRSLAKKRALALKRLASPYSNSTITSSVFSSPFSHHAQGTLLLDLEE
jgi:hypothetical protein